MNRKGSKNKAQQKGRLTRQNRHAYEKLGSE
jgi:hypothetical protein